PILINRDFSEINNSELLDRLSKMYEVLIENEKFKMYEKGILTYKGGTYNFAKGTIDSRIKYEDRQDFLNEYIVNQFYANFELSRLLSGDIAFYKGSQLTTEDRKTQYADYDKRFGQSFVTGRELGYSNEYSDVVKQNLRIEVAKDVELPNETLGKISKKYLKNNQTDAQGFVTMKRQREQMIGQGTYTGKFKKAYERLEKGGTDAKDINTVFQAVKGFYYY